MATTTGAQGPSAMSEDDWKRRDLEDEQTISNFLAGTQEGSQINFDDVEFSQEGKADDAEDFGDISDEDLPDDDDVARPSAADVPGLVDDSGTSNETDDLFGGEPSSPLNDPIFGGSPPPDDTADDVAAPPEPTDQEVNFPVTTLVLLSNQDSNIPEAPENVVELVKQVFPTFEKGVVLNFNEQLAPQPGHRSDRKPGRPPKPLVASKLSLEYDADQEKQFRIPGPARSTRQQKINDAEASGFVSCLQPEPAEAGDGDIFPPGPDDDVEPIGGFSLRDIELVCEDWDVPVEPPTPPQGEQADVEIAGNDDEDEWDREFLQQVAEKRRKVVVEPGLPMIPRFAAPSFDSFEEAAARSAKRVYLDFQDPFLLFDNAQEAPVKRPKLNQKRMASGHMGRDVAQRFNYANDQAYAQLKESHQSKVRAQHTSVQVEHSVPAAKLLWPYYSFRHIGPSPHDYHRPQLKVTRSIGTLVKMSRVHKVGKKERRGKKIQELFATSRDLSLNDNSTAVLFEYCEEIPIVLSNFGMGNKIINYHRLRGKDDEERPPKPEMGEQQFLQPEDKSPFSIFGAIDPGESVPTLHNPMYHAPIFRHAPRPTDFLIGRTTTGLDGSAYYIRKIDHLYVVGQNFPLAAVPGPHSRAVTSLSKTRLKMVAYRMLHKNGAVSLADITGHVKDSNDAQNRQKLKEFLHYNKDSRSWGLNAGEHLMDLAIINSMIRPEEVCLLDAMHVGKNELAQNGYQVEENAAVNDDDDDEREDLANSMVPWKTTKSFIDACSGKAMLQLHGAGDPTGRGLGFSFIKTSMKGGYMGAIQGPAATSADAMERERKANGGHLYNVKKQEALYNDAIGKIWGLQMTTLQDNTPHDDEDVQPQEDEDDRFNAKEPVATPAHVEDRMSQMSRPSALNDKKQMKITRTYVGADGEEYERTEFVYDPGVIAQYAKQRALLDLENIDPYSAKPTGNQEYDRLLMQRLETEEARVNRNQERRHAREKQKAAVQQQQHEVDPDAPTQSVEKGATTRKCANCLQQGHIKTNKKLCPLLNGTWKAETRTEEGAFGTFSSPPPLAG